MTTVTINYDDTLQNIDGFGGTIFSISSYIKKIPEPTQTYLFELLFSEDKGVGFSVIRSDISPSTEIFPDVYNINSTDNKIWYLKKAQSYTNTPIKVLATVLSPPARMKSNNSTISGYLLPGYYKSFSNLLKYFIDTYNSYGVPIYAYSLQNEPNYTVTYISSLWSDKQFKDFIDGGYLPDVNSKFLMPEQYNFSESVSTLSLLDLNTASKIDIVGVHAYGMKVNGYYQYKWLPLTKSLNKQLWLTEIADLNTNDPSIKNGIFWAIYIYYALTVAQINVFMQFLLTKITSGTEGTGLTEWYNGILKINKRLYTIGQYSKFVRPGYIQIKNPSCKDLEALNIFMTMYKNPDNNQMVIVIVNNKITDNIVNIKVNSQFSTMKIYRTSETEDISLVNSLTYDVPVDSLVLQLTPMSVMTFVLS